jgi:hypothetical protein
MRKADGSAGMELAAGQHLGAVGQVVRHDADAGAVMRSASAQPCSSFCVVNVGLSSEWSIILAIAL